MALYPKAIKKLIPAGSSDPAIKPVGIIYHVAVSEGASLYDYFAHRSGGIESHFYIRRDGTVEQYRDTSREADANYRANSFGSPRKGYLSVETQGMGSGEWTDAQIKALKELTVWAAKTHGFPLRKASGPFSGGVGYHTMFGAPSDWTPVSKSCPGPDRVRQFHNIIVPWLNAGAPLSDPKPKAPKKSALDKVRDSLTAMIQRAKASGKGNTDRTRKIKKARNTLPGGKKKKKK